MNFSFQESLEAAKSYSFLGALRPRSQDLCSDHVCASSSLKTVNSLSAKNHIKRRKARQMVSMVE